MMSEEAAPVADAAPAAEAPVADAPAVEIDLDTELTGDTFERAYVEQLRKEAADRRTKAKEWEQKYQSLYEGFEDQSDVEYLLNLGRKAFQDPAGAAAEFERITRQLKEMAGEVLPDEAAEDDSEPKYLTEADLKRIEQEKAVSAAEAAIQAEATELGYELGSADHAKLIHVAFHETKGDLKAAHEKILGSLEAVRKAAVEEYIKSVQEGAAAFPSVAGSSGGAAPGIESSSAPKDFKQASASALERLGAMGIGGR